MQTTEQLSFFPDERRTAYISKDQLYRYTLHRVWNMRIGSMVFVMMNPSTADYTKNDPTIRRCVNFARDHGLGGISVVNLFAWRATDPRKLNDAAIHDPIGPDNNYHIAQVLRVFRHFPDSRLVCAWGAHKHPQKDAQVENIDRLATSLNIPQYCLGMTLEGAPRHPLFVPKKMRIITYRAIKPTLHVVDKPEGITPS